MSGRAVAVVGAGPAGLAATKELLQEGHDVTCFEKADDLGGIFRFRPEPDTIGVWETCRLTSSILVTSFSDFFPRWREAIPFDHRTMPHSEYLQYLRQYACHFDVLGHIRFGCEVKDISPAGAGGWRVTLQDGRAASEVVEVFDAVAVCTGLHVVPHTPDLPGLDSFQGQVLHAAHYKNPSSLRGSSAVFIGAGETGGDIIGEASVSLERSYLSLRRGVFVLPRLLNGLPNDYTGTRLLYSLPDFVSRRSDARARSLRWCVAIGLLPLSLLRMALIWGPRLTRCLVRGVRRRSDSRSARVEALIRRLRAEAGGNQFETFATKTECFVEAIIDGRCELRPAVRRITPTGVVFSNGDEVDVDTIVLCTGFEPATISFFSLPVVLDRLYFSCFDPRYGETLAFIGFVRPPIGSIPPMAEMQSRWFAQLITGNLQLPSASEMQAHTEQERAGRLIYHHRVFNRLPHLVDFSTYMDALAEIIGCKPRMSELVRRPRLLYKVYTAAFSGAQFRLCGPHARPEMATRVLLHAHSHARAVRFLDIALAEAARRIGLTPFRPHLSLIGRAYTGPPGGIVRRADDGCGQPRERDGRSLNPVARGWNVC